MIHELAPHPGLPPSPVRSLTAEVTRLPARGLALRYVMTGPVGEIAIPPRAAPMRTDALWKTTCFEAFVHGGEGPGYLELNFAPSGQWAAYRFTGPREGMAEVAIPPPAITLQRSGDELVLMASVDLAAAAPRGPWSVALTAVIEDLTGGKSYWSLAHPPGEPDFHHAAGFALDLPDPEDA